jgi:hypothetical protein
VKASNETEARGNGSDKRKAQTFDAETGKPDPTPRRIDLSTLRDVRLELAAVYRKMDSGEIESQDGTRRAYVLKTIHDVIVSAELERRILELEEKHEQRMQEAARPALPLQH